MSELKEQKRRNKCRIPIDGKCCCQCIYRLKAAVSKRQGDLGWAAIHANRWACFCPDLNVVTVFHWQDKGHGLCECFMDEAKHRKLKEQHNNQIRQQILSEVRAEIEKCGLTEVEYRKLGLVGRWSSTNRDVVAQAMKEKMLEALE